eukprot:6616383-Pyramimonas_sp.AAC.1
MRRKIAPRRERPARARPPLFIAKRCVGADVQMSRTPHGWTPDRHRARAPPRGAAARPRRHEGQHAR